MTSQADSEQWQQYDASIRAGNVQAWVDAWAFHMDKQLERDNPHE